MWWALPPSSHWLSSRLLQPKIVKWQVELCYICALHRWTQGSYPADLLSLGCVLEGTQVLPSLFTARWEWPIVWGVEGPGPGCRERGWWVFPAVWAVHVPALLALQWGLQKRLQNSLSPFVSLSGISELFICRPVATKELSKHISVWLHMDCIFKKPICTTSTYCKEVIGESRNISCSTAPPIEKKKELQPKKKKLSEPPKSKFSQTYKVWINL